MKQAMITVEILISILILFMVIATSTTTIKQLKIIRHQQVSHEELYTALLNAKDYIDNDICISTNSMQGRLNSFVFEANCQKTKELKSYAKAFDIGGTEGNVGNILVQLYKVTLVLKKRTLQKSYVYYKTVAKR